MKLSDYVIQFIADEGVRHIFMLPGGGAMHLNDSVGRCKDVEFVCNLHEQASAIAAENYAKVTCNLGACLVTTGPGGTNAITGLAGAWLDSTPCIFVSGQVKRPDMKRDLGIRILGVQEVDIVAIVSPLTKYAVTVLDPATIRYHLEKAVYLARTGRPGPVWIDIPLDVQASTIDPGKLQGFDAREIPPAYDSSRLPELVRQTIERLNVSERPVLLAGNGIRLSKGSEARVDRDSVADPRRGAAAYSEFLELADLLQVPIQTTWLALDLFGDEHPLFVGRPGSVAPRGANFSIQNADFLLAVGARLDLVLTAYAPEKLARGASKVMVDIDAAELNKMGRTIDLPIHADAGAFLREMLRQKSGIRKRDRSAWLKRCLDWKERYPVVLPEHRVPGGLVSVYYLSEVLSQELQGNDLLIMGSSGAGIEILLLAFHVKKGLRYLHTTALGAMGFGLPASIGACVAAGRRRTVCVDGDGGFQLNIQELETVARLKLPIKFFILNNNGFSSIRTSQKGWFEGRTVAADPESGLTLPDIRKVATAYGLDTALIPNQTDLPRQVRDVLNHPGPIVCEVMTIADETRAPRVSSMQKPDGTMVSRPLEDLWPFLPREEFLANMIVPPLED